MRLPFSSMMLIALVTGFWTAAVPANAGGSPRAAQQTSQAARQSSQKEAAKPSDYVGNETCETCHADAAKSFHKNPHSRLAVTHNGELTSCESCHGPGKAHVDAGGDPTKIFRFTKASPKQINTTCLSCHTAAHPNFLLSEHAKAGLSCTDCHSTHFFKTEHALKAPQPQLCENCHADIKTQFSMPFHHRVPEGLVKCTDCHDPHGTFQNHQLRATADQNAICTKCHTETAGPFVYEHPAVKAEGCTACHSPHGSPNPRLLKVNNVNALCLQCHAASMNFTTPGTPSFHNQAAQYVSCTSCHTQIHGSNASSVFFK